MVRRGRQRTMFRAASTPFKVSLLQAGREDDMDLQGPYERIVVMKLCTDALAKVLCAFYKSNGTTTSGQETPGTSSARR